MGSVAGHIEDTGSTSATGDTSTVMQQDAVDDTQTEQIEEEAEPVVEDAVEEENTEENDEADLSKDSKKEEIIVDVPEMKTEIEELKTDENTVANSMMEVHFLDVGQGDCTLIICDGEAMLIDAGDNDKGTKVQLYLKKHGVEKLKYVIGTHPDSDHIGGLDVILYKYDCGTVIMPDKSADSNTYRDVIDTLKYKNYSITYPVVGKEYLLGNAKFVILGPRTIYGDDNNCSVALKLYHGDNTFLFTGDAEEEAENDYLYSGNDIKSTVLKVGHHGSKSSTGSSFLKAVAPAYAVISCGMNNEYGHPHASTLNSLRQQNCKVFRTDEQGSIVATSDGKSITWNCSPSETWQAGEPKGTVASQSNGSLNTAPAADTTPAAVVAPVVVPPVEAAIPPTPGVAYILNTNTKKFHYPTCSSVGEMKEKNKQESSESRDAIIARGFVPCKRCNP